MSPTRGLLDLLDDAIVRIATTKRKLLETTDPSIVRRWKVELQDAESMLLELRRRIERSGQLTP